MLIKKNWKIGPHGFTVGLTVFFFFSSFLFRLSFSSPSF